MRTARLLHRVAHPVVRRSALLHTIPEPRRVVVVHGGAWSIPDSLVDENILGVEAASLAGMAVLKRGGGVVEAAKAAVEALESNPVFDAGVGSVLNELGEVEMDAMIMDGKDLSAG